jgi:murein DD-endopeptidase MepM/ murein hydrolase activator NlpD
VVYSRVARRTASKLSELEVKMGEFGAILEDILSMTADSTGQLRKIPGVVPVENFSIPTTGATVGMKMHPFYKTITQHTGLDIVTSAGTKVFAAADGVVESVVKSQKGKGNQVIINHGNGYVTTYSHLTNIVAKKGQRLKRGDILGRVGTSGTVFAPHLHYEVIYNGEFMNPIDYFFVDLNPVQYREMMMIGLNTGQSLD